MIIFETERLRVRQFTTADRDNYFALSGNEEVMRYIRSVKNRADSDTFLDQIIREYILFPGSGRWGVEERRSGKFVGQFAIIPIPAMPDRIQLGYSLLVDEWGKGYATELTRCGLDYFWKNLPGDEIYGVTEEPNVASQKVLIKTGFEPDGHFMEEGKKLLLFVARRVARQAETIS